MPNDRDTIRDAAFAATVWDDHSDLLARLIASDADAALAGMVAAADTSSDSIWALVHRLELFSIDQLLSADAPAEVIERKQQQEQREALTSPVAEVPTKTPTRRRTQSSAGTEPEKFPTLSSRLAQERNEVSDSHIAYNAQHLAQQVKDLTEPEAADLASRLDEWWPSKPYRDTITWESENSWRQENLAAAWLWFGPPLDKAVSPTQWAELACCGVQFNDQQVWLRGQATNEGQLALAAVCDSTEARIWSQALSVTPDPIASEVVDAVLAHLVEGTGVHEIRNIGERLFAAAGADPVTRLLSANPDFGDALDPLLARSGDIKVQKALLAELRESLCSGGSPQGEGLDWLASASDESLLEDLFACLENLYSRPEGLGVPSHYGIDVLHSILSALRNIGGRAATDGYDELIARGGGLQFLTDQRDAIAQELIRESGLAASRKFAAEHGLPEFAVGESTANGI